MLLIYDLWVVLNESERSDIDATFRMHFAGKDATWQTDEQKLVTWISMLKWRAIISVYQGVSLTTPPLN